MELIINLNFPFGRFHGREFPPSPSRLFQSLIAGSHRGIYELQNAEIRDAALAWLEMLAPPIIESSLYKLSGSGSKNYVPNNDNSFSHIRTEKSLQAFVLNDENNLRFVWNFPNDAENKQNAETICKLARLVTNLGHGQDAVFVRGEVAEAAKVSDKESTIFRPKLRDGANWTVPAKGSLASYKRRYDAFLQTGNSHTINAVAPQVEYVSDDTIDLSCPYALFELREVADDEKRVSFDGRDLRQPAAMVRHAVTEIFNSPKGERFKKFYGEEVISRKVFGHQTHSDNVDKKCADESHLAFIPIPNLYPDGKMRRVLLAGFNFQDKNDHELFEDIAGNLNGVEIKDNGKPKAKLIRVETQLKDSIFPLEKTAKVWRSVTPIILSGFTRRGRTPKQLIYRALNQIGIENEAIESIAAFRAPLVPKTFRPMQYKIAENDYLNETPRYHAEIIFKRPVSSVLVIGRGRHAGFGLMMPVE